MLYINLICFVLLYLSGGHDMGADMYVDWTSTPIMSKFVELTVTAACRGYPGITPILCPIVQIDSHNKLIR